MNRRSFFAAVVGGSVAPKVIQNAPVPLTWAQRRAHIFMLIDRHPRSTLEVWRFYAPRNRAVISGLIGEGWGPKP